MLNRREISPFAPPYAMSVIVKRIAVDENLLKQFIFLIQNIIIFELLEI